MTPVQLVQLVDANDVNPDGSLDYTAPFDRPYDWTVSGDPVLQRRTFGFFATDAGLDEIATYADGIGPWKRYIVSTRRPTSTTTARSGTRTATASSTTSRSRAAAADLAHPSRTRPGTRSCTRGRSAARKRPRRGLRRQSRGRVRAVLRAGRRRRVLGLRRRCGRGARRVLRRLNRPTHTAPGRRSPAPARPTSRATTRSRPSS